AGVLRRNMPTSLVLQHVVPTMLGVQHGSDRHLGPEAAGAVLILQATFVDKQGADAFWLTAAGLTERHFAALWEMITPTRHLLPTVRRRDSSNRQDMRPMRD
ncbi:MAG TPA: hypothetical protein VFT17_05025, partial [Propionibacteriaceae bacterium]|nr:hypothetical protein [Propionibacteriaceae bacterium]